MENLSKHLADFLKTRVTKKVILVRHGEALAEYTGSILGWTNSKLTIKGRTQAHALYKGFHPYLNSFDGIYSADLSRVYDTANIALGFKKTKSIIEDPRIRERNYGKDEGVHYDSLKDEEKKKFEDFDYHPEGGETWKDVQKRSQHFFQSLKMPGNYLVFSAGGLICANTFDLGYQDVIPHGSCVGLELNSESKPSKVLFVWELPEVQVQSS